jgi:glycosyltransferase involved in cell wall biosynthesis
VNTVSPSAENQRVLMFAYYFPPLGGGGVQRTLKYVKYLPSEGFDSIVVSGGQRGSFLRDDSLSRDVSPGTIVLRARAWPLQQAQWKLDGLLRRAGLPTRMINEALWPDELIGWLPAALLHGLSASQTHRPHVIYSTSSPTTAHLAALIVHRLTGLPWVADFRDSWMLNPQHPRGGSYGPLARASAALEQMITREATYVTFADESMQALGLKPDDPRRAVIYNGVDPDDLSPPSATGHGPKRERFRLSYVGSFYGRHDGGPVFSAVRDLIERGQLDPSRFELRIVGHASLDRRKLDSLPITFTGYVGHRQAIAEMASASALLFSRPPGDRVVSGKIFEYLTSGRSVLCIADPDNLAYRLVEELGAGHCANVRDVPAISRALQRLLAEWQQRSLHVNASVRDEVLRRFSRRKLTGDLAVVLRAAIADRQATHSCAAGDALSARLGEAL